MVIALARDAVRGSVSRSVSAFSSKPASMARVSTQRPTVEDVHSKILVAEDDSSLRTTLVEILRSVGYAVSEAEDGESALAALRKESFDVLILDLHMPRLDGVALLERFDAPPPVVVVHSAFEYYRHDELQAQLGHKVFRYLRKPVAPPQLIAALEEAMHERRSLDGGDTDGPSAGHK
jgi:CheY-like chemotaxis protein